MLHCILRGSQLRVTCCDAAHAPDARCAGHAPISFGQTYSGERQLITHYEQAERRGAAYSWVVRFRPDSLLDRPLPPYATWLPVTAPCCTEGGERLALSSSCCGRECFRMDDHFFVATRAAARVYMQTVYERYHVARLLKKTRMRHERAGWRLAPRENLADYGLPQRQPVQGWPGSSHGPRREFDGRGSGTHVVAVGPELRGAVAGVALQPQASTQPPPARARPPPCRVPASGDGLLLGYRGSSLHLMPTRLRKRYTGAAAGFSIE